jgi:hypothetical protein
MKTKKALAVLLAVVMLVMPLAVSSFAAGGVVSGPIKTVYTDSEYFNPLGISVTTNTGNVVAYTPGDSNFRFEPALNELLAVNTDASGTVIPTTVAVYYDNEYVGSVEITVNHVLGELTAVGNGHGKFCLGCGTIHEFEAHTVSEWIPNDDGGIFVAQTQTGYCDVCGVEITETIPDSEIFLSLFDGNNITELEGTIIGYIQMIAVSLIQALVGIK